jgi:hypothetical protein
MVGVAILGLLVLCCSTVPAVLRHRQLARDHDRLCEEIRSQETRLRSVTKELHAARTDAYVREHALRELVHPPVPAPPPATSR